MQNIFTLQKGLQFIGSKINGSLYITASSYLLLFQKYIFEIFKNNLWRS